MFSTGVAWIGGWVTTGGRARSAGRR
ncbi:hypothetical protein LINGRAHAP2_LOCUS3166 [Linum grandiflorum]